MPCGSTDQKTIYKEFDVRIFQFRKIAPQNSATVTEATLNQFLGALTTFSSRCENRNSVFLGQTNYRDKLGLTQPVMKSAEAAPGSAFIKRIMLSVNS